MREQVIVIYQNVAGQARLLTLKETRNTRANNAVAFLQLGDFIRELVHRVFSL